MRIGVTAIEERILKLICATPHTACALVPKSQNVNLMCGKADVRSEEIELVARKQNRSPEPKHTYVTCLMLKRQIEKFGFAL